MVLYYLIINNLQYSKQLWAEVLTFEASKGSCKPYKGLIYKTLKSSIANFESWFTLPLYGRKCYPISRLKPDVIQQARPSGKSSTPLSPASYF